MTPEGRVKHEIKKTIKRYGKQIWSFWPVQTGFGRRTVDVHLCIRGRFLAIEVKAPGEKPTGMQTRELTDVGLAGGLATWVDSAEGFQELLDMTFPGLVPL